jgi:hypothetical protein
MAQVTKCGHPNCSCVCNDGKKYCSQACEDAKNTQTLSCDCPHPGCNGKM